MYGTWIAIALLIPIVIYRMFFLMTRLANIYDKSGRIIGSVKFGKLDKTFKYGDKHRFNVDVENSSVLERRNLFGKVNRVEYTYNIDNPNPLIFNKEIKSVLNPELYNVNIETKVAQDLNDLSKTGLSQFLTPRNLIIGAVIIFAIIYFSKGGKIA